MIAGVIAKQKEMYDVDLATAVIDKYSETEDIGYLLNLIIVSFLMILL